MIDYVEILTRKYKGRQWKFDGTEYDGLTMLDDGPIPTQKELDDQWPTVAAEIKAEKNQQAATVKSAWNKLKALGLTEAEISALVD